MKQDRTDNELRGLAMAVFDDHERGVDASETEAALVAVRERIAAGGTVTPLAPHRADGRSTSPWVLFGAAAAVVALVAGGLVAVLGDDRGSDVITPQTLPPTVAPDSTVPDDIVPDPTTSPTTQVEQSPIPAAPETIAVDAANPPPLVEPIAFASLPLEPNPNGNRISVAIGETHVVVSQPDTSFVTVIEVVAPTDSGPTRIDVSEGLTDIVVGPGNVVYGFGDDRFGDDPAGPILRYVGVPYAGDRAGDVVVEAELGWVQYTELAANAFGHGPDGVVDRTRDVNATVIGYVDEAGEPVEWPFDDPALITWDRNLEGGADLVSVVDADLSWELAVTRDPAHGGSYTGPSAPAPTSGNRVVYSERIGASTDPGSDFALNAMPVVAILNPDGSGSWVRLPDDWDVVATDVWGTVLARTTSGSLELALLDDALVDAGLVEPSPVDSVAPSVPTSNDPAALAIPANCVTEFNCTQLAGAEDGRIVAYDPTDETIRTYDEAGANELSSVTLAEPLADAVADLVHVGPDDVVYVSVAVPDFDVGRDLLAIPLVGPNAGTVVMRYTGLDGSGDSSLIPQKAGLVSVGCCGLAVPRPIPDSPLYHWVDRDGSRIESTAPTFRLDLGEAGNNLARINTDGSSTFFNLPTVFQYPRDFPVLVPTDDGGALASDYVQLYDGHSFIVRFRTDWPEFGIDNSDVVLLDDRAGFGPVLLEPSGTVILRDDQAGFVRRALDEVGTPGWPGGTQIGTTSGNVEANGLNDYVSANQPSWAADPELFGLQIKPAVDSNESVQIDFDEATQVLTITTSGFLDDSVGADRITVQTERGEDGLLRFVSGTYGVQCQPGRGHQDFSTELCA